MLMALFLGSAVIGSAWWMAENTKRKRHSVSPGYQDAIQLPYQEEFELYHNVLSLCSMKSRVCLAELGIPYRSHHIDLIETGYYENIRAQFLAVNPAGTVPVLLHHGHPVYESHEQIRYVAEHAPEGAPQLIPDDPELKKQMEYWIDCSSLTNDPLAEMQQSAGNCIPGLTLPLFAAMVAEIPSWKFVEGLLFHFDKRRPLLFLTLKQFGLKNFGSIKPVLKIYQQSRRLMAQFIDQLEKQLQSAGGPWLLGKQFTLADVSWMVIFERFNQANCLHLFVNDATPACEAYWQALQTRPGYTEGIVKYPHPLIALGTQRIMAIKSLTPQLKQALEE